MTFYSSAISIYPADEAEAYLNPLFKMLKYDDQFNGGSEKVLGYIIEEDTNTLYVTRGVNTKFVERLLMNYTEFIHKPYEPEDMMYSYDEIVPPRDENQADVIDFISSQGPFKEDINESQLFVEMAPGFGKTYCTTVGAFRYGKKCFIIAHKENIIQQWAETLVEKAGFREDRIHRISAKELYDARLPENKLDYDVFLCLHASVRNAIKAMTINECEQAMKNLGIGLKVVDEAHLNFGNTILMDLCFHVPRNLYLTATAGRSVDRENTIFHKVFSKAKFYKPSSLSLIKETKKWVDYTIVHINTHVPKGVETYRLIGNRGMTTAKYGTVIVQPDKSRSYIGCTLDIIKTCFNKYDFSKILVLLPTIQLCNIFEEEITNLNYDESFKFSVKVGTIHSGNSKDYNEDCKSKDIICSTIQSSGTGTDIKGLTAVICMSPYTSHITAEQVMGRLRYNGYQLDYYDIVNDSLTIDKMWLEARYKTLGKLAYKTRHISWTPNIESGDKNEESSGSSSK